MVNCKSHEMNVLVNHSGRERPRRYNIRTFSVDAKNKGATTCDGCCAPFKLSRKVFSLLVPKGSAD